jgi:hypothetical protein
MTRYEAFWDHKASCFPIGELVALAMEPTWWMVWLDVRMLICLDIESRLAQLFPSIGGMREEVKENDGAWVCCTAP